jgi:hypothetical protein
MFILTSKEYKSGLILNEHDGKLGILYGHQKGDKLMPFWVYRQSSFKKSPIDRAMPHRVVLGTPQQAKIILEQFLKEVNDIIEEKPDMTE